ncbi:FecCD family ABC transporter permease [Listeria ilorinensis]|uniref:FecCD family ABC transporter permease n=1 Tax=Listeria ilorinensis TaxID=2867439 RepID=UPI001EF624F7|nr:iron ABC transporter permease [Listeria ilorinensis]
MDKERRRFPYPLILLIAALLLLGTALVSLMLGTEALSFSRIFSVLTGQGTILENFILFDLRLPRLLIVILAGAALVISGSLLQTLLKNDLADPGIIGINSGAGVGVAIFFLFFAVQAEAFGYLVPLAGCLGGLFTASLIILVSKNRPEALILNGIGFSFALSGLMVLLMSTADQEKVDFLTKWLSGSIWGTDWVYVAILAGMFVILLPFVFYHMRTLDLLTLDEYTTINLGIAVKPWRFIFMVIAVIFAAVTVSITGTITFLGLMGPHIARSIVGPKHRYFLPLAIFIGAELFLFADIIAQRIHLPTGILLSIIGSPYFIYLLLKKK